MKSTARMPDTYGLEEAKRRGITLGQVGQRIVLENEHVRVWEVRLEPGETIDFHIHYHPYNANRALRVARCGLRAYFATTAASAGTIVQPAYMLRIRVSSAIRRRSASIPFSDGVAMISRSSA